MGNTGRLIIIAFPIAAGGPRGMKSILKGIQADLRDFLDRPSLSLLIVCCKIEHSALLLKSLDALEQDTAVPDIFLAFSHEFDNQSSYVEGILAPHQWDASLYASAAYAGGFAWEEQSDKLRRREFWQWYLSEAVPSAWEA